MNGKRIVKAGVKGTLWGVGTYAIYMMGRGVEKIGKGIGKIDPILIPVGLLVEAAGEIVKTASVLPGIGVAANAVDAVAGVVEASQQSVANEVLEGEILDDDSTDE